VYVVSGLMFVRSSLALAQSAPDTSNQAGQYMAQEARPVLLEAAPVKDAHNWSQLDVFEWTKKLQSDMNNGIPNAKANYGTDPYQATGIEGLSGYNQLKKSCANTSAPVYQLPIGRYDGNHLVGILETDQVGPYSTLIPGSIQVQNGDVGLASQCGGWTFERSGMLYATIQTVAHTSGQQTYCAGVVRYYYESPDFSVSFFQTGTEQICNWTENAVVYPQQCQSDAAAHCSITPTKQFWSQSGQVLLDMTNTAAPVLHYPNGDIEVLGSTGDPLIHNAQYGGTTHLITHSAPWFTQTKIDRNGNTTRYVRNGNGDVSAIVDSDGRTTAFTRNAKGCVTEIDEPGPNGAKLAWKMNWDASPRHYDPNDPAAFGTAITCGYAGANYGFVPQNCGVYHTQDFTTLQSIIEPDGRSYQFTYGLWGNLTQVAHPDGLVTQFGYGWAGGGGTPGAPDTAIAGNSCVGNPFKVKASQTEWPQGLSGPSYTTTVLSQLDSDALYRGPCSGKTGTCIADCPLFGVTRTTRPDGSVLRQVDCGGNNPSNGLDGKPIAAEILVNGAVVEGHYYGDLASGTLWYQGNYSTTGILGNFPPPLEDFEVTQIKHVKDGGTWWEKFTYEAMSASIGGITALTAPATIATPTGYWYRGQAAYRSFGNVLSHATYIDCGGAPCGTPIKQTATTYQHGAYQALLGAPYVNFGHLPHTVEDKDGQGNVVTRTDKAYDQAGLTASGGSNLNASYIVNGVRGNDTSSTKYTNAAAGTGPIVTRTNYFDNGATKSTQNPLDAAAGRLTTNVTAYDFSPCFTTTAPSALFSGGGGSGASATCSASGSVTGCSVTNAGSGYTTAPTVVLQGGAGFGATAKATLAPSGIGQLPLHTGAPYASAPAITITGGGGSGAAARVSNMGVIFYNGVSDSNGSGYTTAPSCTISGGGGSGAACACVINTYNAGGPIATYATCSMTATGSGYTSVPAVAISGGGGTGLHRTAGLEILAVTTTAAGSGYTSPPTATYGAGLQDNGYTTTVPLAPTGVGSVQITNGGSGYSSTTGSHLTTAATVVNALGHAVTSVHDCFSLKELSVVNENGQKSCIQYDGLGRVVETAAPGDTLSSLPLQASGASASATSYLRDPSCATNQSSAVGAGGAGPTTWIAYHPFGLGGVTYNQVRTVSSARDGTSNGLVSTVFVDGLGRSIEKCHEVDPATNGGSGAVCTSTAYDNRGRPAQSYYPFYVSAMPTSVASAGAGTYEQTLYDALDRVTSTQRMKSGAAVLPPSTVKYTYHPPDTGNFPIGGFGTWMHDENGWWTEDDHDVLGRLIEHWTQTGPQNGEWVRNVMQYDAAGRLTTIIDPGNNVTSTTYDGLGRKTKVVDPDLGTWSYVYNDNGFVTQKTDARGAVTYFHYDALDRMTLRDLPYLKNGTTWVAGTAGEEDEFTYYDSVANVPASCYSCDDHCSTTADSCIAATLACTHTGTACVSPNQ
jgi:YD repeat-containing protein